MKKYRKVLSGSELTDKIQELKDYGDVDTGTLDKIKEGIFGVNARGDIWDTSNGYFIATAKEHPPLKLSDRRTLAASRLWSTRDQMDLFDQTVTPNDWEVILKNWAEEAKLDWKAAKELFETRFGKAPVRHQVSVQHMDSEGVRDTAMSRVKERMKALTSAPDTKSDDLIRQVLIDNEDTTVIEGVVEEVSDVKIRVRKRK